MIKILCILLTVIITIINSAIGFIIIGEFNLNCLIITIILQHLCAGFIVLVMRTQNNKKKYNTYIFDDIYKNEDKQWKQDYIKALRSL